MGCGIAKTANFDFICIFEGYFDFDFPTLL
jgi:hypothetical protein